jgi:hypothetical protein
MKDCSTAPIISGLIDEQSPKNSDAAELTHFIALQSVLILVLLSTTFAFATLWSIAQHSLDLLSR